MSSQKYIERPPRIQPELPQDEVIIPVPPEEERDINQPIIQLALPLITIIGYVMVSIFGGGRNPLYILPMAISVVASVGMAFYSRYQNNQNKGDRKTAYGERLIEMRKELNVAHDMQRRYYRYNYPAPTDTLMIVQQAAKRMKGDPSNPRLSSRLWERRATDIDFGALRLGMGALPSSVIYKVEKGDNFEDPLMRDALRLAEDSEFVTDVPITVTLRKPFGEEGENKDSAGAVRQALGIAGNPADKVYGFMRALLIHYATFHPPTDAKLFVLGTDKARNQWRWLGSLPHAKGDRNETLCFENDEDRADEKEKSAVYQFLRNLRKELDQRALRLQDADNNTDVTLPHLLVVIDMLTPLPDGSWLSDLETDPAISLLMNRGEELGGSILFLTADPTKSPSGCEGVIEISVSNVMDEGHHTEQVNFRYAEVGLNSARYTGKADIVEDQTLATQFARQLAPFQVRKSYGADLPPGALMMDMLGIQTSEELRQTTLESWTRNKTNEDADWLKTPLGLLSGGDVRRLKFSADADGVHGLIAGSTGSGKSELLMTMIIGLALNYDPSIINFVLVDFKGGAAFEPFRNLPHVVDIVTNLRGNAVERMFAAITAELNRRQAINVATDSKHLVHYRQRGLHQPPFGAPVVQKGKEYHTAPYPHLFVFVDEFAEMIAENPEYKAQLNSITRLGRALGVTLILAAQRPTGVTDQMRANIKFRIALRVETREESGEVLRRPDAAYLPTGIPGRGYLQVGNENIELIQVAWTGSEYRGGQQVEKPNVIWHDRQKKSKGSDEELPKVFEMMVDMMADLAKEHSIPQRKPWPNFLPLNYSLQTPIDVSYMHPTGLSLIMKDEAVASLLETAIDIDAEDQTSDPVPLNPAINRWMEDQPVWKGASWDEYTMRGIIGLIDNPYNSEQLPLVVDLRRGHGVVFGASGWGKTTFMRTLMVSLAALYSPKELHAYILDFGGRQLNVFKELPHVGAVIFPDEEERVQRLLRHLDSLLEERKQALSDAGADDLYSYNAGSSADAFPSILILIDNFAEFRENFDMLMPSLISIVRESRAYGIHFLVSAELPSSLSGKLYSLLTERFALKLSDPTEYAGIVGRGARNIDDIPGRGYVKIEKRALEFQVALPVESVGEGQQLDETQKLAILVRRMAEYDIGLSSEDYPANINTLAIRALLRDLAPPLGSQAGETVLPIMGIGDTDLQPWAFDVTRQGPHCLVMGPPNSGKTTTLRNIILGICHSFAPQDALVILIDFQQRLFKYGGDRNLGELPHVAETIWRDDQLEPFLEKLTYECGLFDDPNHNKRPIFIIIDNYPTFSDDAGKLRTLLPALGVLARERGTDGLHFILAGPTDMTRISDDLRRQTTGARYGIAMQVEPVGALGGKVPRSLAQAELPQGRGFVVKSGRTFMLQVATPYANNNDIEGLLDTWVAEICDHFEGESNEWMYVPPEPSDEEGETALAEEETSTSGASNGRDAATPAAPQPTAETAAVPLELPAGMEWEELKELIAEKSKMPAFLIESLPEQELLKMADSMGALSPAKGG